MRADSAPSTTHRAPSNGDGLWIEGKHPAVPRRLPDIRPNTVRRSATDAFARLSTPLLLQTNSFGRMDLTRLDLSSRTCNEAILCAVMLLTALTSCRDYDLHSRLTVRTAWSRRSVCPYGREQAEEMASPASWVLRSIILARGSGQKVEGSPATPERFDVADIQADPLGYRLHCASRAGGGRWSPDRGCEPLRRNGGTPAGAGAGDAVGSTRNITIDQRSEF